MRPKLDNQYYEVEPENPIIDYEYRMALGKILNDSLSLYRDTKEISDMASVIHAQSRGDRLSEDQIETVRRHQTNTMNLESRQRYYEETPIEKIYQGIAYKLLRQLLQKDFSIKSCLNIGCNYAYIDWLLSKENPNLQFKGVDFNEDLIEVNKKLISNNLKIYSGYALEMLEKNIISADITYFSSCAMTIRNQELHAYLNEITKKSKYVIFSEPVYIKPGGIVKKPSEIPPTDSMPLYIQKNPLTGEFGYMCWNHNYKKICEENGFDSIEYTFSKPDIGPHYWVTYIGQNKNINLW